MMAFDVFFCGSLPGVFAFGVSSVLDLRRVVLATAETSTMPLACQLNSLVYLASMTRSERPVCDAVI